MNGPDNDKVILFPKTIEYYQVELTRLLETERYAQAIRLLRFLLACQSGSPDAEREWRSLLEWLEVMFPEGSLEEVSEDEPEEPELTESDLLHMAVLQKADADGSYAEKLLASLQESTSVDKQMLALDQLAYLAHADIDETVRRWLAEEEVHPAVQFKALQVLKKRGATGPIELVKWNEKAVIDIEDTPSGIDEFPSQIHEIVLRVQEISEISQPMLAFFAQETWREFLAFVYGTSMYRQMLKQEPEVVDVWASVLHLALQETMFPNADKEEILELYGITSDMTFAWEQAYRIMKAYMRTVGPPQL